MTVRALTALVIASAACLAAPGAHATCPTVPVEADWAPVVLPAACTLPFDAVAYSASAHERLMSDAADAVAAIDAQAATIRRLVRTIENTPPPVSRAEWFGIGAAAGAALGLAIWGVAGAL